MTWLTDGWRGLQELGGRLCRWRIRPIWWLAAVLPLLLYAGVAVLSCFAGEQCSNPGVLGQIDHLPDLGIAALPLWVLTFGLGEESGWRGYALPRLQRGRSALSATLLLWLLWAFWHLPMFFYRYEATMVAGFATGLLAGAITLTWLYNSTGGSILAVAVWHGAFNFVTGCSACKNGSTPAILSVLIMVGAVLIVLWFKPATLSHREKQI
jgi:membrane protease YdiL (CAAX protease family)